MEPIAPGATPAEPPTEPAPALPSADSSQRTRLGERAERRRLPLALLFSLLIHGLLLSLTFGGDGSGLPGLGWPWQERRVEAPELRVVLLPAQVVEEAPQELAIGEPPPTAMATIEPAVGEGPVPSADDLPVPMPPRPRRWLRLPAQALAPAARQRQPNAARQSARSRSPVSRRWWQALRRQTLQRAEAPAREALQARRRAPAGVAPAWGRSLAV
ncbi:MAG: hypothetical protein Q8L92_02310, partial [Rubrivivax sp.]|nr:hypothetical protein [Rubrivivax sp.]